MRRLLDASSQRLINVVETLILQDDWITTHNLAESIGVSERTISEDIAVIKKRWGSYLDIEISTKKGIKVHNQNIAMMERAFIDIFNEATALRWLAEIFFFPRKGIDYYEEKLFVSKSTLIRLLPRINDFFVSKGISIQHKNNKYQILAADEQYLRQFFTGFFIELYGFTPTDLYLNLRLNVLTDIVLTDIIQHILKLYTPAQTENSDIDSSNDEITGLYFKIFYFISLTRENQGYIVASDYSSIKELTKENITYIQGSHPNISEENLRPIHEFINSQYSGWASNEEKILIQQETKLFFDRVFSAVKTAPNKETLRGLYESFCSLYLNAKDCPYKTSELFDRIYYFSLIIKKYNASLYEIIEKNLQIFSHNINFDMMPKIHNVTFWFCMHYPDFFKFTPIKKVLVVSDFGIQHARFLASSISYMFNRKDFAAIEVDTVRYQDISHTPVSKKYDIVITTIPNLPIDHTKIILINDYPTHNNLCEIYKAITLN